MTLYTSSQVKLIGCSKFVEQTKKLIQVIAKSDLPVLITGPTGTGKEIIAKLIHLNSNRKNNVYLSMNCATLGSLAESELFGHVSGAFTGAVRGTQGFVGSANNGTLHLDEVAELSLSVQAKLLRFLDSGEYYRVGESKIKSANVRIITATNKDLKKLTNNDNFREDLYYRLCGAVIQTVALNKRPEDIPLLIDYFLQTFAKSTNNKPPMFTPDAIEYLQSMTWDGNVRQLKNTVLRLCHLSNTKQIDKRFLIQSDFIYGNEQQKTLKPTKPISDNFLIHVPIAEIQSYHDTKKEFIKKFDYLYFKTLLTQTNGCVKNALQTSKMHRKNFYAKLKELNIKPKDFR